MKCSENPKRGVFAMDEDKEKEFLKIVFKFSTENKLTIEETLDLLLSFINTIAMVIKIDPEKYRKIMQINVCDYEKIYNQK